MRTSPSRNRRDGRCPERFEHPAAIERVGAWSPRPTAASPATPRPAWLAQEPALVVQPVEPVGHHVEQRAGRRSRCGAASRRPIRARAGATTPSDSISTTPNCHGRERRRPGLCGDERQHADDPAGDPHRRADHRAGAERPARPIATPAVEAGDRGLTLEDRPRSGCRSTDRRRGCRRSTARQRAGGRPQPSPGRRRPGRPARRRGRAARAPARGTPAVASSRSAPGVVDQPVDRRNVARRRLCRLPLARRAPVSGAGAPRRGLAPGNRRSACACQPSVVLRRRPSAPGSATIGWTQRDPG